MMRPLLLLAFALLLLLGTTWLGRRRTKPRGCGRGCPGCGLGSCPPPKKPSRKEEISSLEGQG
jgi:hypothetical protein